ncbi:hypothetical protein ACIBJI_40180 [Nocardia sp. NPDC050408]|uniref:hypothetical protein n=1 Tax=Nocardia sp. NPDC050408 TaxID=3364319 RepID=UPI0037AA4BC7
MALTTITIYLTEGHLPVHITGDQVTEHFAITPAVKVRPDGSVTFTDHGRRLTHIPTGRMVTASGFLDLRRFAEELEKLPIDWAQLQSARSLTKEQMRQVKAVQRDLNSQDDSSWPWPKWAGDQSQAALSLLAARLDDAVTYMQRYDLIRSLTAEVGAVDPELGRKVDAHMTGAFIGNHIHSYGVIYLLAVLHRIDPDAGDRAARALVGAWEDGGALDEWIYEWRRELGDGQPLTLHEFPDLTLLEGVSA